MIRKLNLGFAMAGVVASVICACSGISSSVKKASTENITVMSYNVHHCNPPAKPGVLDIDAIAAVINETKPDLVGLQEIDVNTERSGSTINQAEELAKKTGMYFHFGKAIDFGGGGYGVAILSRYPISEARVYPLTSIKDRKGEPRVLLTAMIKLPSGKEIRFANTHLDSEKNSENRLAQTKDINVIASKDMLPVIITGDFNAYPGSAEIKLMDEVFKRTCNECGPTIPADKSTKSIDFIGPIWLSI
ncbi:MAG: endonuclease/exonuclease/phosphatase, partial [Chitinophagaceae bacterium]